MRWAIGEPLEWCALELRFAPLYSPLGRPSIPLRVMIGLLILAELRKFSDEETVKELSQSIYWN